MIVASLPSSQDYVPATILKKHGCLNFPEGDFNCYHFYPGQAVTTEGWSFPLPTYMYGNWIDNFSLDIFKSIYVVQGVDYEIIGRLTEGEFKAVIQCFLSGTSIKRKFRKLLEDVTY